MAAAYQYVLTTDGIVHFTAEGESKIAAIRNRIHSLASSDLPFTELDAKLDSEIDQLWAVVDEQLVSSGRTVKGRDPRKATKVSTETDTPDPAPLPSPDPEPTPSASPALSPSPSPKPSESTTASPSSTATASS